MRDVASISNVPTIEEEWDLASADLAEHAREQGWWDPAVLPRFNFARTYGDYLNYPRTSGQIRVNRSRDVLARQHYELLFWRRGDAELNYRRFFAVTTLAGVRVEDPAVFDASHVEIVRWIREGLADGLRVDHPDGLADPGGYLDVLADATGGAYVLVEKILEHGEELPAWWATDGTTGYDAMAVLDRVLIDPAGEQALRQCPWPGNLRELRNAVRRMVLLGSSLELDACDLKPVAVPESVLVAEADSNVSLAERVRLASDALEAQILSSTLAACRGNKAAAARTLRIDYTTLHRKLKRHGISG